MSSVIVELSEKYTTWAKSLVYKRKEKLEAAMLRGEVPTSLDSETPARKGKWRIELPDFVVDQRNQMTGPANDMELVVKMINSGAPGVMLDLEDSLANNRQNIRDGINNCIRALEGRAYYKKNGQKTKQTKDTVIFVRPRGLHIFDNDGQLGDISGAFYDVVQVVDNVKIEDLKHPVCFYIPKSESAEEALWWRSLFRDLADIRGLPSNAIKCMALVESFPLAYEMEEFIYNLRDHIVGLNLGRWDYMASLIHFHLAESNWTLPDRNTIPHDVAFFQNLRHELVNICNKRGILAIGGMTALYPNRKDAELNARAMAALEADKKNEAECGFSGAWSGHPDQNEIAVAQFPAPNQIKSKAEDGSFPLDIAPDVSKEEITETGTRAAINTCIIYRFNYLKGSGATLINGYMEDLATDRIYRLMIAQRIRHGFCDHCRVATLFDDEKQKIIDNNTEICNNPEEMLLLNEAALQTMQSIFTERF